MKLSLWSYKAAMEWLGKTKHHDSCVTLTYCLLALKIRSFTCGKLFCKVFFSVVFLASLFHSHYLLIFLPSLSVFVPSPTRLITGLLYSIRILFYCMINCSCFNFKMEGSVPLRLESLTRHSRLFELQLSDFLVVT